MKLALLLCCLILLCDAMKIEQRKKGSKKREFANGIEFNKISRASLLKLLTAFEQNIHKKFKKQTVKPVFTAQFANNPYTRPFIYKK